MSQNVSVITYKRNASYVISTRTQVKNPLNGLPMLGTGTLAKADASGALALNTDYAVYAAATSLDGATVILSQTPAVFVQAGGWDYELAGGAYFTGANGSFLVFLRVYQFGFSDLAHQVGEWRFEFQDSGT